MQKPLSVVSEYNEARCNCRGAKTGTSLLAENERRIIGPTKSNGSFKTGKRGIDHIIQQFCGVLYKGGTDHNFVVLRSNEPFLQKITSPIQQMNGEDSRCREGPPAKCSKMRE